MGLHRKTFRHFNFPEQLIKWIKTFYKDIETCIINNGHTTNFFKPERGVRQGCPLSPYLFIVAVEMLSMTIKQDKDITGISGMNNNQYTISQFADDTSIAINNKKGNMENRANISRCARQRTTLIIWSKLPRAEFSEHYRSV